MATTTMVHVRVDEKIKAQATEALAAMGLSVSDAVHVFLMRVVADKQMPFALKVPNAETRAAMAEADEIVGTHRARFDRGLRCNGTKNRVKPDLLVYSSFAGLCNGRSPPLATPTWPLHFKTGSIP
jgi:DNA-damage-inducible protein J